MNPDVSKQIHDIRNPLNVISMNAELAKMLLDQGGDVERIKHCLDKVLNACQQAGGGLDRLRSQSESDCEEPG